LSLHGLLPIAPFLILAAWALPAVRRSRRFGQRFVAATAVLYLVCGAALIFVFAVEPNGDYRTGLEWGNRYLLVLYPLATVLALAGMRAWRRATHRHVRSAVTAVAAALLLIGLQMEVRGVSLLYGSRSLVAAWQQAVRGPLPVVSDIWWLPAAMAPYFADHPMFCVRDRDELATWIDHVQARGEQAFSVATLRDLAPPADAKGRFSVAEAQRIPVTGLRVTRYRLTPRPE
jgi:hypothetical protein